ncbi:hypothetical protein [Alloalcanivorax venustensis]|uniref:hypothetical protein n=1 Tax=Alloalcanivorax venustensis TaxID=172371 RepID=UPI0035165AD5
MKNGSIYFVSDKAVHDALTQYRFKKDDLKEIFLSRGIITSPHTPREDVAMYFSTLNHDYYDHQKIAEVFAVDRRKDKTSVTTVAGNLSRLKIQAALKQVSEKVKQSGDASNVVNHQGYAEISFKYEEVDYNKTEFKQVSVRESSIRVEYTEDGCVLRWPHVAYAEKARELILDCFQAESESDLDIQEVSLAHIDDPSLVSEFFTLLSHDIDGFSLVTVTDVYFFNPNKSSDDEDQIVHIDKASLKGSGVTHSPELKNLQDQGFYIWKIRWQSQNAAEGSDIYEFEAQLSDPETRSEVSYVVLGYYEKKPYGDEYVKTRKRVSKSEEIRVGKILEKAINFAFSSISSSGEEGDE